MPGVPVDSIVDVCGFAFLRFDPAVGVSEMGCDTGGDDALLRVGKSFWIKHVKTGTMGTRRSTPGAWLSVTPALDIPSKWVL